ncbi:MAG: mandelate racemase/muconate lactonizing enzyme family protein [Dehalococcoidia bacterium]
MSESPIVRVWWQGFSVPMRAAFAAAHGQLVQRDGLILGFECADGSEAAGEASPLTSYAGGTVTEVADILSSWAPAVLGRTPSEVWASPWDAPSASRGAVNAARCGIETAAASLAAFAHGQPLGEWLRAASGVSVTSAEGIPVNAVIDAGDPLQAATQASAARDAGFMALKLKVGRDAKADLARLRAVSGGLWQCTLGVHIPPPRPELRVDANGSWTPSETLARLRTYEACDVSLCEQPISHELPGALDEMARLRKQTGVAIAADESCRSLADLDAILDHRAADAVVIKPTVSGLREAALMVARANQARLPAIVTSTFEAGIGLAAAIHLASLVADPVRPCGLTTGELLTETLVQGLPRAYDGVIDRPGAPGLGVEVDHAALAKYATALAGKVRR